MARHDFRAVSARIWRGGPALTVLTRNPPVEQQLQGPLAQEVVPNIVVGPSAILVQLADFVSVHLRRARVATGLSQIRDENQAFYRQFKLIVAEEGGEYGSSA